jgi:hypothetical protein
MQIHPRPKIGMSFSSPSRRSIARALGRFLIAILWVGALTLLGAMGAERYLQWREGQLAARRPRLDALGSAYEPFTVAHLNPHYLFFFPLEPERRAALSNRVVTLTADGFRGPGPERAAPRRLAFLIGGSAAFGDWASSDATTITGYLNQLSKDHFFVNAGVPSWNSTQELFRLANQLLDFQPSLIVAYDGANDAAIVADYFEKGHVYPPGTPESFDELASLVDDIRGEPRSRSLGKRLFPRLGARLGSPPAAPAETPAPLIDAAADVYVRNLELMSDLAHARGVRFLAVFQPIALLHRNLASVAWTKTRVHHRFHSRVTERERRFEFGDFSSFFDHSEGKIRILGDDEDITDATLFVDEVHLFDPGNRRVAEGLLELIASRRSPQSLTR